MAARGSGTTHSLATGPACEVPLRRLRRLADFCASRRKSGLTHFPVASHTLHLM
jgi:hypothetical protein